MRRLLMILCLLVFVQPVYAGLKKCVDSSGNYHYYDSFLPVECQGNATVEMNQQGIVINRTDAANQTNEHDKAESLADKQRIAEQKKQDAILLNIYTSAEEIDLARERNLHPITLIISGIKKRLNIAHNRLVQLQQQAEAAKVSDSQVLASIEQDIIPVQKQVATLKEELMDNQEYMKMVQSKFDADKKRFLALTEK